jgi:pimeloyl-ACP methyl ester carboxylesterase
LKLPITLTDARGLATLALDGARLITDVVEHTHAAVLGPVGLGLSAPLIPLRPAVPGRTRGIPGVIYRAIHAGYDVADASIDLAFRSLGSPGGGEDASTAERERALAILNGVWGDHLDASGNPLAIQMAFRHDGAPLALEPAALSEAFRQATGRVVVFVHGLCMNERAWQDGDRNASADLACELGYTPLYLHYNSGLHISTNGRRLAGLMETLIAAWPVPVEEIALVGHSMGALVARAAAYYGALEQRAWRGLLRRLVFLAAPHHGSGLERVGHWADDLMGRTPFSAPFRRLGVTRSAGITDLRYGNVVDEDWQEHDRFGYHDDRRVPLPLPDDVACYMAAATLGARAGDVKDRLLGDGLVPLDSALGTHGNPEFCCGAPPERQWVGYRLGHVELLRSPEMYARLREWLAEAVE